MIEKITGIVEKSTVYRLFVTTVDTYILNKRLKAAQSTVIWYKKGGNDNTALHL